jgi:pilus assembly protein CpaE
VEVNALLRGIIICPDEDLAKKLETAAQATGELTIGRVLNKYPTGVELTRAVRTHVPEVVFVSFEQLDKAQEVVLLLKAEADGIPVIAIGREMDQNLLRAAMRAGIRDLVVDPFPRETLLAAISAVKTMVKPKPPTSESTNQIFAFVPSKAGVGASTIALNVSAAMARGQKTHVLLSDFDLSCGMIRFMLKLQNARSVADAVENSGRMDASLWLPMVTAVGTLDVLHSGPIQPSLRIDTPQTRGLVDFMRRNYRALCFDFSANLERYAIEIMQDCKRIVLVCTPEISSLRLAHEKLAYLRDADLATRVLVVLNRTQRKALFSNEQVEEILGVPVANSFPNDYAGVAKAMADGSVVEPATDLGKSFVQFAQELMELDPLAAPIVTKRKFLDFFGARHKPTALNESQGALTTIRPV